MPWSVYRWLPGEHPEPEVTERARAAGRDLAASCRDAEHHLARGAQGTPRWAGRLARREDPGGDQGTPRDPGGGRRLRCRGPVWEQALRAPGWDGPPVWLHADLMPGNLLTDGGRLASVIDFGCIGVGDPACDLFPAWNLLPGDTREVFREALAVDDATWNRGRGRTLSQALIALPYYRRPTPRWRATPGT